MDRLQTLLQQLQNFFLALPPARRASFLVTTLAVVLGTLGVAYWTQRPQYRVLFANLEASDAAAVVDYLKNEKIEFRVGEQGGSIEVPASIVHETRLALAGKGVPQGGGVGFEIFDKQTIGMTDFVQRLDYQRALQGELARTISDLAAVESARVHLALPERSLFVAEDRRPSASVVLKLKAGRTLAPDQIAGVVHLVASSVEGLRPNEVTIVDTNGQVLSQEGSGQSGKGFLTFQRQVEQDYVERIEGMLERVLGPQHAIARVTALLDMAQVEKTEESFDPDRVALRNEKRSRDKSVSLAAGAIPGATATLTNEQKLKVEEGPRSEREDSTLNYEISKVTSRRVEAVGGVKKLSVAVVIDGIWEGEGEARKLLPRSEEEMERYRELIKRAVGFNEERGDLIEVTSASFQSAILAPPEAPSWLAKAAVYSDTWWRLAGILVSVVLALTVVRPFLMGMLSRVPLPPVIAPPVRALPGADATPDAQALLAEISIEPMVRGPLLDAAKRYPDQAARVLTQWIAENP